MPRPLSEESLGYRIHTNRELGMMLRGQKPLAVFSDYYGCFHEGVLRYLRNFDRHVATGRFEKREFVEHRSEPSVWVHYVLYSQQGEEWRIDALLDLYQWLGAWTSDRERAEGTLLGYEDWQNDLWIATRFGQT